MKTNELMIGDWVLHHNDGCIDAMNDTAPYDEAIRIEQSDFELDECFWSRLDPIPITPEILEKNGFKRPNERVRYFMDSDDYYDVAIHEITDSIWYFEYQNCEVHLPPCCVHIAHVHELQHVLHLCGIDKEITI